MGICWTPVVRRTCTFWETLGYWYAECQTCTHRIGNSWASLETQRGLLTSTCSVPCHCRPLAFPVWVLDPFWAWIIDFTKQGQKDWIQAIFKTNAAHISSCNIKFTIMWMFLQPLCVSCLFHSMPAHPMYEFGREKKCNFTCHLGKVTLVIFYCLAFWALEEKHQEVYPCQRIWPLVNWETQCAVSVLNQLLHCLSYIFKCPPA